MKTQTCHNITNKETTQAHQTHKFLMVVCRFLKIWYSSPNIQTNAFMPTFYVAYNIKWGSIRNMHNLMNFAVVVSLVLRSAS